MKVLEKIVSSFKKYKRIIKNTILSTINISTVLGLWVWLTGKNLLWPDSREAIDYRSRQLDCLVHITEEMFKYSNKNDSSFKINYWIIGNNLFEKKAMGCEIHSWSANNVIDTVGQYVINFPKIKLTLHNYPCRIA